MGGGCWPLGQGDASLITSMAWPAQPVPEAERRSSDVLSTRKAVPGEVTL